MNAKSWRCCSSAAEGLIYWQRPSVSITPHVLVLVGIQLQERERKTLRSFPSSSDFPFSLFLKTFTWFSRQIPRWGDARPARVQLYFIWIKKYLLFQSPLLLYYTFFPFATFLWFSLLSKVWLLWSFCIIILTMLFLSGPGTALCFMETNIIIIKLIVQ